MIFKRYCVTVFAALSLFIASPLSSAQLVSILLTDTFADNIGYSVEQDLLNLHLKSHRIADITGLELKLIVLSNTELNIDEIYNTIGELELFPDDVVIVYYSGHGYRTEDTETQWPNMFITVSSSGMVFEELVRFIQDKNPRLIIALADCCNNEIQFDVDTYGFRKNLLHVDVKTIQGFKKLFLSQKGVILASGSSVGEYSIGTEKGGAFTLALLDSLEFEVRSKGKQASWQRLMQRTVDYVYENSDPDVPQTPQYIITNKL